jgi:tRNA(Ile)-lysidine synthase
MDLTEISCLLRDKCLLDPQKPLVVGVSGGPDSLCLLHLLHRLGYIVIAGHVNHQLRETAGHDEDQVREVCRQWGIPVGIERVDVRSFAQNSHLSLEEGARILRYRSLMQLAAVHSAQALAVAHQADDQIETMLMHLLRGSGMPGLKGMQYRSFNPAFSRDIPIVRPLLRVARAEIEAYCAENSIEFCEDETNSETKYFRNRIRHELIPVLENYNPQVRQHLEQTGRILAEENRYLEEAVQRAQKQVLLRQGEGFFLLSRERFWALDIVLQRRILRDWMIDLRGEIRDISFSVVEAGLSFAGEKNSGLVKPLLKSLFLASGEGQNLLLYREDADLGDLWPWLSEPSLPWRLSNEKVNLSRHWQIRCEIFAPGDITFDRDPQVACFDAGSLSEQFELTPPAPGDRFAPFGMNGREMKVGDYFTNQHIPLLARGHWPILRAEGRVLWVAGLRQAEFARVSESTRRILKLSLLKID